MSPRVAVIGAGLSGAACARALRAHGVAVDLIDRGHRPGGRMASPTLHGRAVDTGAAYFTTKEPDFIALVDDWSPLVEAYVDFDLVGKRSRTSAEAVGQDVIELYGTPVLEAAIAAIRPETTMLVAPRGMVDEIPGLYPPERMEQWAAELPALNVVHVPDTNHYTIAMSHRGAAIVAEHARLLSRRT